MVIQNNGLLNSVALPAVAVFNITSYFVLCNNGPSWVVPSALAQAITGYPSKCSNSPNLCPTAFGAC